MDSIHFQGQAVSFREGKQPKILEIKWLEDDFLFFLVDGLFSEAMLVSRTLDLMAQIVGATKDMYNDVWSLRLNASMDAEFQLVV